jgi:hypothetical protein
MVKPTNLIIVALVVGLIISLYFNFHTKAEVQLSEENSTQKLDSQVNPRQVNQNDNAGKVTSLYNQMLASLPAHDLYCIPSKKSYCTSGGCEDVEANTFTLIGKGGESLFLARCDSKPCDMYDVDLLRSGAFTTLETKEPHGMLFRTSNIDQSFIEVVTLGTESFVTNGYCYQK